MIHIYPIQTDFVLIMFGAFSLGTVVARIAYIKSQSKDVDPLDYVLTSFEFIGLFIVQTYLLDSLQLMQLPVNATVLILGRIAILFSSFILLTRLFKAFYHKPIDA